ncbi:MAG: cupin domain-containing protein [Desulfovibrionaceae bacterium]|nr:cupin domain-containing protein [Desulfovibrionaceae bacterium]
MIRRAKDNTSLSAVICGGPGAIEAVQILNPDEFCGKGRLFNHITLKPGVAVGKHRHKNDFETYYILSGSGVYDDNGTLVEVGPGDVMICAEGEEHSLTNNGTEDLVIIALVLFDKKD